MADRYFEENSEMLQTLEGLKFFKDFGEEHLQKLSALVKTRMYKPGETVLEQGTINKKVFFLLSGVLIVEVDGEEVTKLDQQGDVLGEMSIVSTKPTAAKISAVTETICLEIAGEELAQIAGSDKNALESVIYRVYSMILADKLKRTNQKAKRFEQTMIELKNMQQQLTESNENLERKIEERTIDLQRSYKKLEQQNFELTASHDKLSEIFAARNFAFESIGQLYEEFLPKLNNGLKEITRFLTGDIRAQIGDVQSQVDMVIKVIRPVAEMSREEKSLHSKRVLIVESNRKQQIIIRMALGGSGVDVSVVGNVSEAKEFLGSEDCHLVLASAENIEALAAASEQSSEICLVLMASTNIHDYLPLLEKYPQIKNVVTRNDEDRSFTTKHVLATVSKLLSNEIFGLEKYMAWGVDIFQWEVKGSEERKSLIDSMNEKFSGLGVRSSILGRCSLVAEEMLMNAIYDAPVDDEGQAKYNHLDRKQTISLPAEERARFRVACDGTFLAVSVADPFGALTKDVILKYLRSCYDGNAGVYNDQKGGAGRGLHQIVENSDLVVFNVRSGFRTEVISFFYLDQKLRAENSSTSFHFFFDQPY